MSDAPPPDSTPRGTPAHRSGAARADAVPRMENVRITQPDLLRRGAQVNEVFQRIVACVVTVEEHDLLNQFDRRHRAQDDVAGWRRYQGAGIQVYDMMYPANPDDPVDLDDLLANCERLG